MRGKCANMEMSNARKNSIPVRSEMHLTDASTGQKHSHWFCQYATAGIYIFFFYIHMHKNSLGCWIMYLQDTF